MNMKQLAAKVVAIEGKRSSISIAQVSEVLGVVADLAHESGMVVECLLAAGRRRAKELSRYEERHPALKGPKKAAAKKRPTAKRGKKA